MFSEIDIVHIVVTHSPGNLSNDKNRYRWNAKTYGTT